MELVASPLNETSINEHGNKKRNKKDARKCKYAFVVFQCNSQLNHHFVKKKNPNRWGIKAFGGEGGARGTILVMEGSQ